MGLAAGQLPDQPGFHGAEQQLALLGLLPCALDVFQDPAQLGAGEVRVDDQAGLGAEGIGQALFLQAVAILTGAAALPDDGVVDGFAGVLVPHDGGLALVGDADGGDVRGGGTDVGHGLLGNFQLGGPDLVCIMLDPAGLGEVLGKLLLCNTAHLALLIEEDAAVGSCTGVQCHYVFCHGENSSFSVRFHTIRPALLCLV